MHRSKLILAAALAAGGATQIAAADGRAPRAAAAQGGVSVSPSIVETTARKGATRLDDGHEHDRRGRCA